MQNNGFSKKIDAVYSAGACVISLDFNVNLWHQSFSSLENLAEQEKLWCQFFCEGLVCQNRLLIEPS